MGRIKDITGEKFSRLFVLRCIGRDKHGNATWLCKCDCGNETVVAGYLLRSGNTKSCGRCPTNLYIKQDNYYAGFLPSGQKFMFDKEDFAIVRRYRWVYDMGYVRMGGCGKQRLFLHNLLLGLGRGINGMFVDHINQDRLDNRRNNLRIATKSQNGMNRYAQSNNTTGYKGVGFMPQNGKYRARIKINGQEFHIGLYATAELAAHAYDRAAVMLHGNFACTNF
jgi:hypothetical protein